MCVYGCVCVCSDTAPRHKAVESRRRKGGEGRGGEPRRPSPPPTASSSFVVGGDGRRSSSSGWRAPALPQDVTSCRVRMDAVGWRSFPGPVCVCVCVRVPRLGVCWCGSSSSTKPARARTCPCFYTGARGTREGSIYYIVKSFRMGGAAVVYCAGFNILHVRSCLLEFIGVSLCMCVCACVCVCRLRSVVAMRLIDHRTVSRGGGVVTH